MYIYTYTYGMSGLKNGSNFTQHPPSPGPRAGPDLPTKDQAVSTQTRTVPGSRLAPLLVSVEGHVPTIHKEGAYRLCTQETMV